MLAFWKYHAHGNAYLIVDGNNCQDITATAKHLCSPHYGIGADGLLVLTKLTKSGAWLKIVNPDGSIAEKSGNGLRIFAQWLYDTKQWLSYDVKIILSNHQDIVVQLPPKNCNQSQRAAILAQFGVDIISWPIVALGSVSFAADDCNLATDAPEWVNTPIAVAGEKVVVTAVSIGNPHCVVIVPQLDWASCQHLGPLLENHPLFLHRTNVQWVSCLAVQQLELLIWERGVGMTQSSGTSSAAAAAVCSRLGLIDFSQPVCVKMPGGNFVLQQCNGVVYLWGNVVRVCHGVMQI